MLKKLKLRGEDFSGVNLQNDIVSKFPKLEELYVTECNLGKKALAGLKKNSILNTLDLRYNRSIEIDLKDMLDSFIRLKRLEIYYCRNKFTKDSFAGLAQNNTLEILNISKNSLEGVTFKDILDKFEMLRELDVHDCKLDENALAGFTENSTIEKLSLYDNGSLSLDDKEIRRKIRALK